MPCTSGGSPCTACGHPRSAGSTCRSARRSRSRTGRMNGSGLSCRPAGPRRRGGLHEGPILSRGVTAMRSFVMSRCSTGGCSWRGTRRTSCRRALPRASTWRWPTSRLLAAAFTAWYADGSRDLLDGYSRACLAAVWQGQEFSALMTSLLHASRPRTAYAAQAATGPATGPRHLEGQRDGLRGELRRTSRARLSGAPGLPRPPPQLRIRTAPTTSRSPAKPRGPRAGRCGGIDVFADRSGSSGDDRRPILQGGDPPASRRDEDPRLVERHHHMEARLECFFTSRR